MDSGDPLLARIEVLNHDTEADRSMIYSSADYGDFYRLIKEGVYDLKVTANGYFDKIIEDIQVTDYQATYLDVELEAWPASLTKTKEPDFRIYPNPSSGKIFIEPEHIAHGELILNILSLDGRVMMSQKLSWHGEALETDLGMLEKGIYFVQIHIHSYRMVDKLLLLDP
jgi:hypothetical protein